jgi:hypothetical protein
LIKDAQCLIYNPLIFDWVIVLRQLHGHIYYLIAGIADTTHYYQTGNRVGISGGDDRTHRSYGDTAHYKTLRIRRHYCVLCRILATSESALSAQTDTFCILLLPANPYLKKN